MEHRPSRLLALVILIGLTLLACDLASVAKTRPTVIISSPPSGSQFASGQAVNIHSVSTDSAGVARVELLVDGNVARSDPAPGAQVSYPLDQTWQATPGTHTLAVRAYNTSNQASELAAVLVTVSASTDAAPATEVTAPGTSVPPPTTATPPPLGPTVVQSNCTNNASYVADVTVPDGTLLATGQTFNKIWRLRNTGTCAWNAGYQFVFVSDEAMTTVNSIPVPDTAPGATADLLIAMTTPATPGTHIGKWRLKSPEGALFGVTVNVTIKVINLAPPPTNTVAATCSGAPAITSFAATPSNIALGGSATLSWALVTNAESAEIDQGIGGVATPGTISVSPTTTTVYTLTATGCGGKTTRQVTVVVNSGTVALPPVPPLLSPQDGAVLPVSPSVVTFSWNAVSFPEALTYSIEVQINNGGWVALATQTGIPVTNYTVPSASGDYAARWRVWATSTSVGDGPKSEWRYFNFSTSAPH